MITIDYNNQQLEFYSPSKRDRAAKTGIRTATQILAKVKDTIPNNAIVIDIGANIGTTSVPLGLFFRDKNIKIYAIEPHPLIYKCLKTNIERYNLQDNIKPFQLCIGDGYKFLIDRIIRKNSGASQSSTVSGNIPVNSIDLDSFLKNNNIDTVHILKLDAEGAEYRIFADFTMYEKIRFYHCEFHIPLQEDWTYFIQKTKCDFIRNEKTTLKTFIKCKLKDSKHGVL